MSAAELGDAATGAAAWWKRAVIYQIYPRSFQDSDGDGVGDLPGIVSRLDYLAELGVGALWLCPVYASPNVDGGYDISDYRGIMSELGTMADMDELLAEAHRRGIKIIMDLVVNHSSDEHEWFIESRAARRERDKEGARRDYYIWRPGRDGGPPNNWASRFGGSAWTLDEASGDWYLHLFSARQPDLNWACPELRSEVYETMAWWLEKGVDGFRLDVINMIAKDEAFPDCPLREGEAWADASRCYVNRPEAHAHLRAMRERVLSGYGAMTIGETPETDPSGARDYVDPARGELDMVFQFDRSCLGCGATKWEKVPWTLAELKEIDRSWYEGLAGRGWNSVFLNNHDQPRMVSQYGDDGDYRARSAKLLATYVHTQPGTPFVYQGEEIGMTNAPFSRIEDCRDIESTSWYEARLVEGGNPEALMAEIRRMGRDNARTPMQWDAGAGAGFSRGEPWIKLNPNYRNVNVAESMADPDSIWRYYRKLISLRAQESLMVDGSFEILEDEDPEVYTYLRRGEGGCLLVLLNFGSRPASARLPDAARGAKLLLANIAADAACPRAEVDLEPWEARLYKISPMQ